MFTNKSVHEQVNIFNKTLMNVFSNFIPNKNVVFDSRDPPCMNEFVKNETKWKHKIYKTYIKNSFTNNSYLELQDAINVVAEIINTSK